MFKNFIETFKKPNNSIKQQENKDSNITDYVTKKRNPYTWEKTEEVLKSDFEKAKEFILSKKYRIPDMRDPRYLTSEEQNNMVADIHGEVYGKRTWRSNPLIEDASLRGKELKEIVKSLIHDYRELGCTINKDEYSLLDMVIDELQSEIYKEDREKKENN